MGAAVSYIHNFLISIFFDNYYIYFKIKIKDFNIYLNEQKNMRKLLEDNKGIWIKKKKNILNKDGEEWIKYLTIPLWCDKSDKGFYQFPNISEDNFSS